MASIRDKDTKPEIQVRKYLFSQRFRYRLHRHDLPGKPDIVMPGRKLVIFVNGCYWHRHSGCRLAYTPKSNIEFWNAKFDDNVQRDIKNHKDLQALGYRVIVIWECEVRSGTYKNWIIQRIMNKCQTSDNSEIT
ncbi:very short patch repair endonuclease [Gilvimarinus japonicus]|uniref:Very short patch repair endonuclease n=2 Tax=Gilvimarinus japonicus TaxID=1796469 RepID=A0ABV7HPE6_9GAMM